MASESVNNWVSSRFPESRWTRRRIKKTVPIHSLVSRELEMRLAAFGIGILVAAAVFGIALAVSDDLRLLYVSGALLFSIFAQCPGARGI